MENKLPKYAFFSVDVERFIDTECIQNANQPVSETMLDGLDRYMDILDKYNIKATMFVLSDVAEEICDLLKKHLANGHKIALHGKKHIAPLLLTDEQFKEQTRFAKERLEAIFDTEITGYRAPCFGIDRQKLDILRELGFKYDSSRMDFSLARHAVHMDMSDFDNPFGEIYCKDGFFEFGMATRRILGKNYPVSGGGYLRISNWFFTRNIIKNYINHNSYYMFYLHPFELSQERRPRIKNLKLYDKMYVSYGYKSYPRKIEYIINELQKAGFIFASFDDALEILGQGSASQEAVWTK